jgi:quinoprotein glucose dehydrogenase
MTLFGYFTCLEAPTATSRGHRPGDNLYSSTLVCPTRAPDGAFGIPARHHDIWDWDIPTPPILANIEVEGRPIRAVVQLTKQSFAYVFDRVTGAPVWPIEERPVPASDVPGERTAPTQPFPTKPAPFDRQGVSENDLIDFTPELGKEALGILKSYRLGPLFQPPSLANAADGTKGTLMLPGAAGGAAWESGAFDPETSVLYVGSSTSPTLLALVEDPEKSNLRYIAGPMRIEGPRGLPLVKPPWGRITAIDLRSGEHLWMQPNGDTSKAVAGILRSKASPFPNGLTFARRDPGNEDSRLCGRGMGGGDGFYALTKEDRGDSVRIALPGAQSGLPITYLHQGRQYVVVSAGDAERPASLVALALPRE